MPYLCITIWCVKHLPLNTMEASLVLSLHQELWEAHHQGSLWEGTCQCQVKDPLLLSTWATLVAPHSIWLHKMEELLPHTIKQWTLPSTLDIKVVHRVWCQVKKISPAIKKENLFPPWLQNNYLSKPPVMSKHFQVQHHHPLLPCRRNLKCDLVIRLFCYISISWQPALSGVCISVGTFIWEICTPGPSCCPYIVIHSTL